MHKQIFELDLGGKKIKIKTTDWAPQANSSCLVSYGETEVLATVVMSKDNVDRGFFPLTVEYEEKFYAAGKIYGSRFIKRESRPTEEAILTARMIDRSIRPLFPEKFTKEIQVVITCLSWDGENDPDIPGMIAASFALLTSDIPWEGPIAALRIGRNNGEIVLNPNYSQRESGEMDLVLSAVNKNNEVLVNMIEMGAKEITEDEVIKICHEAEKTLKEIIDFQLKSAETIKKEKFVFESKTDSEAENIVKEFLADKVAKAVDEEEKFEKSSDKVNQVKEELLNFIAENEQLAGKEQIAFMVFENLIEENIIKNIIEKDQRPDGRNSNQLRQISCEVSMLPRAHGSAIFHRGLTKVLAILTLGGPDDQQILEGMEIVGKKRFMHHYNFPPFSVGEVAPMRGPKRREIGHGNLAEKAVIPVLPEAEKFPYTIRIVSEALSSNGSTSMASTCAASLTLMDAGVPISSPVAGIAIGLAKDKNSEKYKVLTDIQGPEDHFGHMDFKVAGTKNGITAIQLDVKIDGINKDIIAESLEKAKAARMAILDIMQSEISQPREKLSAFAPKIFSMQINPSKIGEVVGPKGSVINKIIEECDVAINIEDSGLVFITAQAEESIKKAEEMIKGIVKEVQVGEVFEGIVRKIMDFGAFVDILPGQSGLVHISKFVPNKIDKVQDVVKEGDKIPVKVVGIDELGRINLSAIDAGFKPQIKK